VTGEPVTDARRTEPARRDALAIPATVLVAVWCLVSFVVGMYWFVHVSVNEHATGSPLNEDPAGAFLFLLTMLLPIAALNVLVVALVVGVIAAARTPPLRVPRAVGYLLVVVAGVAAQLWAWSARGADPSHPLLDGGFAHDGRLDALILCSVSVLLVIVVAALLRVWPRPLRR
jgi:hypothetical protein